MTRSTNILGPRAGGSSYAPRRRRTSWILASGCCLALWGVARAGAPLTPTRSGRSPAAVERTAARRGLAFVENRGQWDPRARLLLRTDGLDLWITSTGAVYDVYRLQSAAPRSPGPAFGHTDLEYTRRGHVVRMVFLGASGEGAVRGTDLQPGHHSYLLGNDPAKWARNVPLYGSARAERLYGGIDVVHYLEGGAPRYDLVVAPGADPAQVRLAFEGATGVSVTSEGSLAIRTTVGTLEQRGLLAYQEVEGRRRAVACAFVVSAGGTVGFETGPYDRARPLVIDPLTYSTYLGGGDTDIANRIAVDSHGNAFVAGRTASTDFPEVGPYQTSLRSVSDAFVTKLDADGGLVYSTYLGGTRNDVAHDLAVDASGNAHVAGETQSSDFPLSEPLQASYRGGTDGFVTKLTAQGDDLAYSTYLGGSEGEWVEGIALGPDGSACLTGNTSSYADFPPAGWQSSPPRRAFVTKLTTAGAFVRSSFVGAGTADAYAIAVDAEGNMYVTGHAGVGFPTTAGSFQPGYGGATVAHLDAFVMKLDPVGTVLYATYLGGLGGEVGNAIAVDAAGHAYVTGYTNSVDFPTESAFQDVQGDPLNGLDVDAFVTKLALDGSALSYSTYLGGSLVDVGHAVAVDALGNACVTGYTEGTFPVTDDAFQSAVLSDGVHRANAFVARLGSTGDLVYSTFLGGAGADYANGIAVDSRGTAYVTGYTSSANFPVSPGAHQQTLADGEDLRIDAFVTKFETGGTLAVVAPDGGESWCAGTVNAITWASNGVANVRIDLSSDGGATYDTPIVSSTAAAGSYLWSVPAAQAEGADYRVRVSDADGGALEDESDAGFTIARLSITAPADVTAPNDPGSCERAFSHVALGTPTLSDWCSAVSVSHDAPSAFPTGVTTVTWTASDGPGNTATATQRVTILDQEAPAIEVHLTPATLWPPNHRMRTITATVTASDGCPGVAWVLTSVTGDGTSSSADVSAATGTAATTFEVRQEKNLGANDRTYTVTYTATDASGNTATAVAHVTVAHDQR